MNTKDVSEICNEIRGYNPCDYINKVSGDTSAEEWCLHFLNNVQWALEFLPTELFLRCCSDVSVLHNFGIFINEDVTEVMLKHLSSPRIVIIGGSALLTFRGYSAVSILARDSILDVELQQHAIANIEVFNGCELEVCAFGSSMCDIYKRGDSNVSVIDYSSKSVKVIDKTIGHL